MIDIPNPQIDLANDYIRNTDKNIFLTGKAGTGKTTFLHHLKKETWKRMAVVAPTGVAAINAGGMTIHSFFQLPFRLHLPGVKREDSQRRFSGQKISLIRSLDLLVIDEISMVRADLLDAVDEVLRRYRGNSKPFGGVQLLMIGDLHQLPPVVKQDDWELLRDYYDTAYFFGSLALRKTGLVTIELKYIYRQSDSRFIELLNKVRDNQLDATVLEKLNSRFQPNFQPPEQEGYITLTSHNAAAADINAEKLALIAEPLYRFKAKIEGDFPLASYPTDEVLEFKKGAQVIFVKNDTDQEKRFYNGKIGQITRIEEDEIYVKCSDEPFEITVTIVHWDNVKYTLDETTKEVKEEILGTFRQYPLKLAWAITIHKSQGLTFERVIIDAQAAFAHGQVYVALSRCKSFDGIVLRSKIAYSSVKTDSIVKHYSEEAEKNAPDEAHLRRSKKEYQQTLLLELFDFKSLKRCFDQLHRSFLEHGGSLPGNAFLQLKALAEKTDEFVFTTAEKFTPHLFSYFQKTDLPEEFAPLQERIKKASDYFTTKLHGEMLPEVGSIQILSDNKSVRKNVLEQLENLQQEFFTKNACFAACQNGFSTQNYMRAKTNAGLDFKTAGDAAQASETTAKIPKDAPHPELYTQLVRWRQEAADETGMELYEILSTRSLLELVRQLPLTAATLKKIKGIGDGKVRRFGVALLGMIENYCMEKGIGGSQLALPEEPLPPKPDTKTLSFDMFKSGKTIGEIAEERGFVASTIEGHLAHFVLKGELDVFSLLDREKVAELEAFFVENQTAVPSFAKAHFGEKYSYGEIKMVLSYLKKGQEDG
jgi:hypothetical protein